jgi:hypothetical protein
MRAGHQTPGSAAVALLAVALLAGGCRPGQPSDPAPAPSPWSAAAMPKVPVDHMLPGELAEGTDKAFGLPLPRVMVPRARFNDVLFASAEVPSDRVANFVRARVTADKVETGPVKTVFSNATVRGQPGVTLSIEVISHGGSTELQVRNLSLVKPLQGLTEEERWRAAGFKPDGTPLDPTRFH